MSGLVKVGGAWKDVSGLSVNIGGTWKAVTSGSVNIAGTWKEFYAPATGDIGSFDLLQSEVLTSSAASVTFSGLSAYASTYQHLQIRMVGRSTRSSTNADFYVQFNGDTGSNYSQHYLRGDGAAVESGFLSGSYPNGVIIYQGLTGSTNTANSFSGVVIDILDPFKTSKYTTIKSLNGFTGSLNRILLESGSWRDTSSVTSITLNDRLDNFVSGSRFSLFGVKKA